MDPLYQSDDEYQPPTPEQKLKHEKRNKRGLLWMGLGSGILALSFGINFIFLYSDMDFRTVMYVMTTVGSILLIKGMTDIFGLK